MKAYHITEKDISEKNVTTEVFDDIVTTKLSKLSTQLKALKICEPELVSEVNELLDEIETRPLNKVVKLSSSQLSFEFIIAGAKPNRLFRIIKLTPGHTSYRVYIELKEDYGKH